MAKAATQQARATAVGTPTAGAYSPEQPASSVFAPTRRLPVPGTPFREDAKYVWRDGCKFDDVSSVKAGDPLTAEQAATLGPVRLRRMWYRGLIQLADAREDDY